jgi:O-antigen ligase
MAGAAGVAICLVAIVGTASRGGSLALGGSLLFYWLYISRNKLMGALAVIAIALGILLVAPNAYFDRMKTIGTYEQDSSAQSRLVLWGYAFEMALDHPLGVGAGNFASAYGRYYAPIGERSANANDVAWGQGRWLNAHSIYFKAMGEYGFVGFFMLIGLVVINVLHSLAARERLLAQGEHANLSADWSGLVAMSVCGFSIGGIFLGGLAYPHMFFLSGLVVANTRMSEDIPRHPIIRSAIAPRRPGRPTVQNVTSPGSSRRGPHGRQVAELHCTSNPSSALQLKSDI